MKKEEMVSINLPSDYKGEPINVNIEYREGKAPEQIDAHKLQKVQAVGLIGSVEEYILKRYGSEIAAGKLQPGIVLYSMNPNKMFIDFNEFPDHPVSGAIIKGSIEINPEIMAWGINQGRTFTAAEIIKLIRAQAHNMLSIDEAKQLIKTLQNFEARFVTELKREDDRRGNKDEAFKQTLNVSKGEMPEKLHINIPIFKGGAQVPFTLEIEIDQVDGDIEYSFYSLDYTAVIRNTAKDAIEASVNKFKAAFTCIEQA